MAKPADHIRLANKNHDAMMHVISRYLEFPEWVATLAFYKALQVVDALCIESGKTPRGHNDRLRLLKAKKEWHPVYPHFRVLWNESSVARYLYEHETSTSYSKYTDRNSPEDVLEKLVARRLVTVEQTAMQAMKSGELRGLLTQTNPAEILALCANHGPMVGGPPSLPLPPR